MKTQIILNSFATASFEVQPVILPWPPGNTGKPAGKNLIGWLASLTRHHRPAHRLPGAVMGVRPLAGRTVRPWI